MNQHAAEQQPQHSYSRAPSLHQLCAAGRLEEARLLLDGGADGNKVADPNARWFGETPLHAAAAKGHTGLVRLLLDRGADGSSAALRNEVAEPNVKTRQGQTAVHLACAANSLETVRVLAGRIAAGGLTARDKQGRTPLDVLLEEHKEEFDFDPAIARLLLLAGCDHLDALLAELQRHDASRPPAPSTPAVPAARAPSRCCFM